MDAVRGRGLPPLKSIMVPGPLHQGGRDDSEEFFEPTGAFPSAPHAGSGPAPHIPSSSDRNDSTVPASVTRTAGTSGSATREDESQRPILSKIPRSAANVSWDESPAAFFLAMMLISQTPSNSCWLLRKNSRVRRLIRFLVTAPPIFLVTVIPRRVRCFSPGKTTARKKGEEICLPHRDSRMNSRRFRSLASLGKEKSGNPRSVTRSPALSREPFPTLGSSTIDDPSSLLGGHPLEKTVRACAANSTGLKCSFHDDTFVTIVPSFDGMPTFAGSFAIH